MRSSLDAAEKPVPTGDTMNFIKRIDYLELIKREGTLTRTLHTLAGIFSSAFLFANSIICVPLLMPPALLKLILPLGPVKKICTRINIIISVIWIANNSFLFTKLLGLKIETDGEEKFSLDEWYMVISNHQSWIDIIALQTVFNRKIPFLKFFIKKELIWVPIMGPAWWALDFPFMKRYSPGFLAKNPHLKGKDIEITKRACAKFKTLPVSIMNFVEGTRFSENKHYRQRSPFNNLLKPKAGGTGFVLTIMGEQLNSILNITIKYTGDDKNFWSLLCGRIKPLKMHIERIPMTDFFRGDYTTDPVFQERIQNWINGLWEKKDTMLDGM